MDTRFKCRAGFSLLELLAVVTILGILAATLVSRISISGVQAKQTLCKHRIAEINKGLERYYLKKGQRAESVSQLTELDIFVEGVPNCPLTGDIYQINPDHGRVTDCRCANL